MLPGISWWVLAGTMAAGALAGGVIAYCRQKSKPSGGARMPLDLLLKDQSVVRVLTSREITGWIYSFDKEYLKGKQCALCKATPEFFGQLGYAAGENNLDLDQYLFAALMDMDGDMKIHQAKLFNFVVLEQGLAEMMDKNQNMIVLDFSPEGQLNASNP